MSVTSPSAVNSALGISIIAKFIIGEDITKTLIELLIAFVVVIVLLIVLNNKTKRGVISRSSLVSQGSALPTFYNDNDLRLYIDKEGETLTNCRPVGKIKLDNEIIEARSIDGYIDVGTKIVVVSVSNNMLQVRKKENENEN